MILIGVGINYVTETFSFIARSVSAGFTWFTTILEKIGLPWEVYSLILIGFLVSYALVSGVFGSFRDSADSVLNDGLQAKRRADRKAAFDRRTQTMKEQNAEILSYVRRIKK